MDLKHLFLIVLITFFVTSCSTKKTEITSIPSKTKVEQKKAVPQKKKRIPELSIKKEKIKLPVKEKKTPAKTYKISGVGDIMMGTSFPEKPDYLPPNDGKDLLKGVKKYFKDSDIVFGNLEGPLLNKGRTLKNCKKCYSFRVPEHYVKNLLETGFNLMSIANNHAGDFGAEGREKTSEILTKNKIHFAGSLKKPYTIFEKNGVKYGFCAFSPNYGTPDLRDLNRAVEVVRLLSLVSDIVIVSFHGGAEGARNRRIKRNDEFFYGENRGNVYKFAHSVVDAGADLVFGHGPHITRAAEIYKNRFIAYSLGNFCTYARFNLRGLNGIAPLITIEVKKNGEFVSGKVIPLIQRFRKGPVYDPDKGALIELIKLTSSDFPKADIFIDNDGIIYKKSDLKKKKKKLKQVSNKFRHIAE